MWVLHHCNSRQATSQAAMSTCVCTATQHPGGCVNPDKGFTPYLGANFCVDPSVTHKLNIISTSHPLSAFTEIRTHPAGTYTSKSCWGSLCSRQFTLPNLENAREGNKEAGKTNRVVIARVLAEGAHKCYLCQTLQAYNKSAHWKWVPVHSLYSLTIFKHSQWVQVVVFSLFCLIYFFFLLLILPSTHNLNIELPKGETLSYVCPSSNKHIYGHVLISERRRAACHCLATLKEI